MGEEKMVGGIKSTNEFHHPPKRERKEKADSTPVSQREAELDLQQRGEETATSQSLRGTQAGTPNDHNSQGQRPVLQLS